MDYPKSVPNVGLVNGRFVDENPTTGQVGSLIPSAWGNSVTQELLSVITAAGLTPNENQVNQLLKAIQTFAAADMKKTVRVATTGAIALSGLQSIDGIGLAAGDRVLVKNQANAAQNGIYSAAAGVWVRAQDADENIEVSPGMMVPVQAGTTNYGSIWQLSNVVPPTVGTTALTFEQIVGNTGIAPGTYKSVTIDRRGRATAGTNPTTLEGHGITDAMPLGEGGWGKAIGVDLPDMKRVGKSRFVYQTPSAGTLNGLSGSAGILLNAEGVQAGWQIFIRDETFYFRGHTGGVWSADRYLWHSGNFTPADKADKATTLEGYGVGIATQVEAEAGTNNTKPMTPLRVAQAVAKSALSFVPVQQGGGIGQLTNKVYLGWKAGARLGLTVDNSDRGNIITDRDLATDSVPGAIKLATAAQVSQGVDNTTAITPLLLSAATQSNPADSAAGKFMVVGAFGSGGAALDFPGNNLNTQNVVSGRYRTITGAGGIPPGTNPQGSTVEHVVWGDGVAQQTFHEHVTGRTFQRACNANIYGPWQESVQGVAGMVSVFAMNSVPAGWLACNGAALTVAAYPELYSKIGNIFGGNSTTFNLPDLRGETIRGVDNSRGVDLYRLFGSLQLDALQGHGHVNTYDIIGPTGGSGQYLGQNGQPGASRATGRILEPTALSNGTPRIADETRSRNIALLYCIKY